MSLIRVFINTIAVAGAIILVAPASLLAQTSDHPSDTTEQFPTRDDLKSLTTAGSYLAARHASVERDAGLAAKFYRSALLTDPKNNELLDRAFISSLDDGDIEEAAKLAERILIIDNTNRVARLVVGVRDLKQKKYSSAQSNINQSIRGPITDLVATLLSSWAAYGAGDARSGVASIDKLLGPDWYASYRDLHAGLILELSGKEKDAGVRFERAYNFDDSMPRVTEAYSRWLSRNKDVAAAIAVYEAFDRKLPHHPLIVEGLRETRAGNKLGPLLDSAQAGAAEALYSIGAMLTRRGGEDLALVYLQLSLYLQPTHQLALLALADLYESTKQPQMAIKAYERVPSSSPLRRKAQIQLAIDLDAADRADEAISILKSATADDPEDLEAIMALGNIERGRKKFADCSVTYSLGIRALPAAKDKATSSWYYYRGICEDGSSQWTKAEVDLKKALEFEPDQPNVLNYLGNSWIDRSIKLDDGIKMIKRAVEQRPDDGFLVDSLGWAHYRIGNYEEAARHLERAVDLKPQNPDIHDHLGDAYWRLGRYLEAKFQWRRVQELRPDAEGRLSAERKVQNGLPSQIAANTPSTGADSGRPVATAMANPTTITVPAVGPDRPPAAPSAGDKMPGSAAVSTGRRVALLFGESAYQNVAALPNPVNDASDVSVALARLDFNVKTIVNASYDDMRRALIEFGAQAAGAEIAVIFFAGHGIQMGEENWLIPIDAVLASERDVAAEAIGLQMMIRAVSSTSRLGLVILDACRNNPFVPKMQGANGGRDIVRGFARVEPSDNVLVAYASRDGTTAKDGSGRNSPFTKSLLANIEKPGVDVRFLFGHIRQEVMDATNRQQQPYIYGSLAPEMIYLVPTR